MVFVQRFLNHIASLLDLTLMRNFISTFLSLFGMISIPCTALAETEHVHPLLGCLDPWEIPNFDPSQYQSALLNGPCFSEMKVTTGQDSCALHGWARQLDEDHFKVLLFGCLEVDVQKIGPDLKNIHWSVTAPIVDPDQKRWREMPLFRNPSKITDAIDVIIIARGYEAGGQRDMARWLVDQVLAKYKSEEQLAKLTAERFADWRYQVAIDRWLANADWDRLASDLDELMAKAPQDWAYLPAIQGLRKEVSQVPRDHEEKNPTKQLIMKSLYGPGQVRDFILLGNWVLFPSSERQRPPFDARFEEIMNADASALPLWAEKIEDDTPCAYLHTVTGRNPKPGELRRRPSWTKHLARRFIEDASLWRIEEDTSAAAIRDQCMRASELLSGKNRQEKFLAAAEHAESRKQQEAAIVGLFDTGYGGSWSAIERQIVKDCLTIKSFPTSVETYIRLRKSAATDLVRQLEKVGAGAWNQGFVKQQIGPNTWFTPGGQKLEELKLGLAYVSIEEVLKKWGDHRGAYFTASPEGRRPIYTSSATNLLNACLHEAIRTPTFLCDFIELAMLHRKTPNNLIQLPWPGSQTSFETCRQSLKKLLKDQSMLPLATRARGQGRLAETPAQMTAWMMLDSIVEYRPALSFDGYAFLGIEWLDELVTECQKTMDGGSLPDLAGVKQYADMKRFTPLTEDTVTQALKWDAAQFRENWRALPLSQRIALASKPVIPVEGELEKLRSVVRHARGQPIVKEGDPFTDNALKKMIDWAGKELPNSKGVCGMVRWRSGLAGVDVETDSFADSSALSHYVFDSFKKLFGSKPDAKLLIIVSARRGDSTRGWTVEAGSPELAKIPAEWKQWREKLPGSKLAQDSIWLVGIAKDILK